MPAQFILSLSEFLVNNLTYFSLNSKIHNKLTINREVSTCPASKRVTISKINCMSTKVFKN
jgi:hypothetical protein